MVGQTNNYVTYIDRVKAPKNLKIEEPFNLNKIKEDKRLKILNDAYHKIEMVETEKKTETLSFMTL